MISPDARESALSEMRRRCKEQGLAFTFQRQVIYEAVLDSRKHPTPEYIYEQVRGRIPSISLGTVYKNVKTFLDTGLLKQVSLHHGSLRLEANMVPHHHLVCSRCKAIFDLDDDQVAPVQLRGALPKGFEARRFTVEILGVCASCGASRNAAVAAGSSSQTKKSSPRTLRSKN
jgi:Fur family transcriptional regulator, peroxide stress response regulator